MTTVQQMAAGTVTSADGTSIAYDVAGTGPALVLVDAAGHYRRLSSFAGLIALLTADFTVYHYDRRGRGDSTDTAPYAVEREVEDLAALIDRAGGSAFLYGFSSGGLVALQAAARGLAIPRMALLEPPIASDDERAAQRTFTAELASLVDAGRQEAAVEHYINGIGVPDEIVAGMRATSSWAAMTAVAHTLVYDCLVSEATSAEVLASVTVPTLILDSEGSSEDLTGMAATIARELPNASHRSLAGAWHGLADDVLAPALIEYFTARRPRRS
jgi:pimeloyl-ACP methyl ester carboxylesterase